MAKYLNKISNIGDSTISPLLKDNLIEFFDWGLLDAGGFFNVSIPTSGQYGGDLPLPDIGSNLNLPTMILSPCVSNQFSHSNSTTFLYLDE